MSDVIDVRIVGVFVDRSTDSAVVLLGETPLGGRVLPIVVGPDAARSIAIGLAAFDEPRPLTHDLVLAVLRALRGRLVRVDVVALDAGTFIGELEVGFADRLVHIDARPSDCIGLAVRVGAPIGVVRDVFERAAVDVDVASDPDDEDIGRIMSDFREFLDRIDPDDFVRPSDGSDEPDAPDDPDDPG